MQRKISTPFDSSSLKVSSLPLSRVPHTPIQTDGHVAASLVHRIVFFSLSGGCLLPVSGYFRDRAVIGSDVQDFQWLIIVGTVASKDDKCEKKAPEKQ